MIRRHKGFSLLEILVAFAIMAVALTIVLRIFGSGVNNAVMSEEYTLAVQIAESLMARVGVETPLQAGESSGNEDDRYKWQMVITPVANSEPATVDNQTATNLNEQVQNGPNLQLLSVSVRVSWGGDDNGPQRSVELNSLKTITVQVVQP